MLLKLKILKVTLNLQCLMSMIYCMDLNPLHLSPFIESGNILPARDYARVEHPEFLTIESYSGYLTVNKTSESNMFFWYFPPKYPSIHAPLILWLQGGPGASSLFGLFTEIGPFELVSFEALGLRKYSWHNNYNLLFIDNPVGTGYSNTSINGYRSNQEEVGADLYNALLQFLQLFPELIHVGFYIAGESYAGKFIPALAHTIDTKNRNTRRKINLQGLLIGNGYVDPVNQRNYADYLYNLGLIDENLQLQLQQAQDFCLELIENGKYKQAGLVMDDIMVAAIYNNGLTNVYDYLVAIEEDPSTSRMVSFLNRDDIKEALHVGDRQFTMMSRQVHRNFADDQMKSVAEWLAELLAKYRVIIYNGQLDIIVAYPLTVNYLSKLNFDAAEEYKSAARFKWFVDGELAGYYKVAGNLTEVLVRNAGHMVPTNQPKWAYDMLNKFIANELLS